MTDFDLKVDSETGQLYAEDPETGDRQPVPFDEIDVNNAGVESLNAESLATERTPVYNAKAHGIEGDGETDDAEAMQELADKIHENGGGTAYFPKGVYLADDDVRWGDKTTVLGAGIEVTIFRLFDEDSTNDIHTTKGRNDKDENNPTEHVTFKNFSCDGVEVGDSRGEYDDAEHQAGVRPFNVRHCHVESVYGYDFPGYAIEPKMARGLTGERWFARNCGDDGISIVDRNLDGIEVTEEVEVDGIWSWDNAPHFAGSTGSGVEIDDGPDDVTLRNVYAWDNVVGIEIHRHDDEGFVSNITVENFEAWDNETGAFARDLDDVFGGVSNVTFRNGRLHDNDRPFGGRYVDGLELDNVDMIGSENEEFGADIRHCDNIEIHRGEVRETEGPGINIRSGSVTVESVVLDGVDIIETNLEAPESGSLRFVASDEPINNIEIVDCLLKDSQRAALQKGGSSTATLSVRGCRFVGSDQGDTGRGHATVRFAEDSEFKDNVFREGTGNADAGIELDDVFDPPEGTVIILNDFRDHGSDDAIVDDGAGTITDPVNEDTTEDYNIYG